MFLIVVQGNSGLNHLKGKLSSSIRIILPCLLNLHPIRQHPYNTSHVRETGLYVDCKLACCMSYSMQIDKQTMTFYYMKT